MPLKKGLFDILKKAVPELESELSDDEQKLLGQKLGVIDAAQIKAKKKKTHRAMGRWYGAYKFYVDWNNDSDFSDTNEDLTDRFISAEVRRGLSGPNSYTAIPGVFEINLSNNDRLLSSDNSTGALYSYLSAPIPVKWQCKLDCVTNSNTYTLFKGWVREISSPPVYQGRRTATVIVEDAMARLEKTPFSIALQTDATEVDLLTYAIGAVISTRWDEAQWDEFVWGTGEPTATIDFATALDTYAYAGDVWSKSSTTALAAVDDIMRSCLGMCYVDRNGTVTYKTRQYRPNNVGTADWDARNYCEIEAVGLENVTIPSEVIISMNTRKRTVTPSVVWTLNELATIPGGQSKTYTVGFSDLGTGQACAVDDPITPVGGTDYTPNPTGISMSVTWYATEAEVVITNSSTIDWTPTLVQLRGYPVTQYDTILINDNDGTTPKRTFSHSAPFVQSKNKAQNFVEWLLSLFQDYNDKPKQSEIYPESEAVLAQICQLDINRKVNVRATPAGVAEVSWINWVDHSIGPGYHICTVGLSPAFDYPMWTLGTSQLGSTTILGV